MTLTQIALSVVTTNPSTPDFIAAIFVGFVGYGIVYFIYLQRKRKVSRGKSQEEAGMVKHIQSNPTSYSTRTVRKFNRGYFMIALILSMASIIFGIDYFWTVPATPPRDFFAGFVFVISGVVVIGFFLRSWVLYKIREFEQPSEQT